MTPLLTSLAAGIDSLLLATARLVLDRTVMPAPDETGALRDSAAFYLRDPTDEAPQRFFSFLEAPASIPTVILEPSERSGRRREWLRARFPSTYQPHNPAHAVEQASRPENAEVHAEIWLHRGRTARGTVIGLHGFAMGHPALDAPALMASDLFAAGLDVILFTLPLHGRRTPRTARFSGQLFTTPRVPEINEAIGQAVHDLRALIAWLRRSDGRPIGLVGLSLGGYVAAVAAALLDEIDFVVPIVAPVCIGDLAHRFMAGSATYRRHPGAALSPEEFRAAFRIHSPLTHRLRLPRDRVLIIAGRGDRVVPGEHAEWLWEHWGRPRLVWFAGGHALPFGRARIRAELCDFALAACSSRAAVDARPVVIRSALDAVEHG